MKHQYVGDINDYYKYGLLRLLASAGFALGVCWLLTPDEDRPDGRKVQYLESANLAEYDSELFARLRNIMKRSDGKHLRHIEDGNILPRARFFSDQVPCALTERPEWFTRGLDVLRGCTLLFFDADNGVEVRSTQYGSQKSPKYVYWRELSEAWRAGASLLIFQHFIREGRSAFIRRMVAELQATLPTANVVPIRSPNVLFLLALQSDHRSMADLVWRSLPWKNDLYVHTGD